MHAARASWYDAGFGWLASISCVFMGTVPFAGTGERDNYAREHPGPADWNPPVTTRQTKSPRAQSQGVADDRHRRQTHRRGGDHRGEQQAEHRVEHTRCDRDARALYANAKNRFCRMFDIVMRDSLRARTIPIGPPSRG